jgi:4-hydroxythreonine-4-phosphate dehydrogenase
VVVVGCARRCGGTGKGITTQADIRIIEKVSDAQFAPAVINVLDEPLAEPDALKPGEVQAQAGDLAYRCVRRATELAMAGDVKAIATAPLNKEALHLAGHHYPGHTELLAHLTTAKITPWCCIPTNLRLFISPRILPCVNSLIPSIRIG